MLTHENVVSDAAGVIKSFEVAVCPNMQINYQAKYLF